MRRINNGNLNFHDPYFYHGCRLLVVIAYSITFWDQIQVSCTSQDFVSLLS